jgi:hypothetical protein
MERPVALSKEPKVGVILAAHISPACSLPSSFIE